jgi:hypothetical protein
MPASEERPLVKIQIELSPSAPFRVESFWAEPLGGDLYRMRNTPFFAHDLNFHDVVSAIGHTAERPPSIKAVVERSGHKTLRILFSDNQTPPTIDQVLSKLNELSANYEKGKDGFYAVDVRPEADYPSICSYLLTLQQEGTLVYDTGPTREDGPSGWRSLGKKRP